MKLDLSRIICINCSMNEQENPTGNDVDLVPAQGEFFKNDEESQEYQKWQCFKCGYSVWLLVDLTSTPNTMQK